MTSRFQSIYGRYRPIVDDWHAFRAAMEQPLPVCVWTNPLRTRPAQLEQLLRESRMQPAALPWHGGAFRLNRPDGVGRQWWYLAGLCHSQEEVSMLPVQLLAPQPGHAVLDLCAAPGGKTAQAAVALHNRGTVVANDISYDRMRPLRAVLERLGLVNVTTTVHDGANFTLRGRFYDRVLVDAPCSGEGIWRRNPGLVGNCSPDTWMKRHRQQVALLRRAVQLCEPGGRIVYSTCTFAPEENELTVDAVLRQFGDPLRLLPVRMDGFRFTEGLTRWQEHTFLPQLSHSVRIWPHHNDSGGFFIAVMEKVAGDARRQPARPAALHVTDGQPWLHRLNERFGIDPTLWPDYALHQQTSRGLHLMAADHASAAEPVPDACGMFFLRTHLRPPKLTTGAAMLLGRHATRNVIDVDQAQLAAYLSRRDMELTPRQLSQCHGKGHVLVRYGGHVLGPGFYEPATQRLESLFPRYWGGVEAVAGA